MKLYLTRHGETQWNIERRLQGHLDSPLTARGVMQAEWLRDALSEIEFDAIYASSSGRAYRTAEIIKGSRDIEVIATDKLRELNMGNWEGRYYDDIAEEYPEQNRAFWSAAHLYQPAVGETFTDVRNRIVPFVEEIIEKHGDKNVLIVTHAITLKTIINYFENRPLDDFWNPPFINPTSVSIVEVKDGEGKILLHGDTSHYRDIE